MEVLYISNKVKKKWQFHKVWTIHWFNYLLSCSKMHIKKLWPVYRGLIYSPWNQIFFLRLLNGRFSCNCMYFFYFLGCVDLCVYKANIFANTLRKRFLSLSPSFVKFLLNWGIMLIESWKLHLSNQCRDFLPVDTLLLLF